jgi:hypothetical membrane protein
MRFSLSSIKKYFWVAPLWVFALFAIIGKLTPDYSHAQQALSELGATGAPYALLIRIFGFGILGIALITLALAIRHDFLSDLPFYLLLLTGCAILTAGIFPTDPHGRRDTTAGLIHAITGLALLGILSVTPFIIAIPSIWKVRPTFWFSIFSITMGILISGLFFMLPNGISLTLIDLHHQILGRGFKEWYANHGIIQRIILGSYFIWLLIFLKYHQIIQKLGSA